MDPRDKPSTKPPPWEGFQTKGLNPKILFSTRDEQQEILSKFGKGRSSLKTSVVFLTRCTSKVNVKQKSPQASLSCLVSPDPRRSMTPRRPSRLRLQKAPLLLSQNLLRATIPTPTISSRRWTGKVPDPFSHFTVNSQSLQMASNQPSFLFVDVRGHQETSDSQGAGSMNDQDDLSDQSEGDSYSYSGPSGEPLSRDPSEPLFDADFQVRRVVKGSCYVIFTVGQSQCWSRNSFLTPSFSFFLSPLSQNPPPAAQDPPPSDTADLLGLNADPQPPPTNSASSSAAPQGFQGGMKAASSNSDLLNDLFAPPGGQTGAVQEDIFFSGASSDSKRMG